MKKLTTLLILLSSLAWAADLEPTIAQLAGKASPELSIREAKAALGDVLDYLLPRVSDADTAKATSARDALFSIALHAGRPGSEAGRELLCGVVAQRLETEKGLTQRAELLRMLEYIGGAESVPALARALRDSDPRLREKARQALAANPSPEATDALRTALEQTTERRMKAGLIYALGTRGDDASARAMAGVLLGEDEALAEIAAKALAGVASRDAVRVLFRARARVDGQRQATVDNAFLDIATQWLNQGDLAGAAVMLNKMAEGEMSPHTRAVVTYGLALAEPDRAHEHIARGLADKDTAVRTAALAAARKTDATDLGASLVGALPSFEPAARVAVIDFLGDEGYRDAAPAVVEQLASDDSLVRVAAARALAGIGDGESVEPLLQLAEQGGGNERQAAEKALAALEGDQIAAALAAATESGPAKRRAVAIRVRAERDGVQAADWLMDYAGENEADIYRAALRALQDRGTGDQVPGLAELMISSDEARKAKAVQRTVQSVLSREKDASAYAGEVTRSMAKADDDAAVLLLGLLPAIGGPQALEGTVRELRSDRPARQEAAARALAEWPTYDAMPALQAVATDRATKDALRLLAVRGTARLAAESGDAPVADRIAAVEALLKQSDRREARVALISALGKLPDTASVDLLIPYVADEEVRAETAAALRQIAEVQVASNPGQARTTLEKLLKLEGTSAEEKREIRKTIREIDADRFSYLTNWLIAGPYKDEELFAKAFAPETDPGKVSWKPLDKGLVNGDVLQFERVPAWRMENCAVYLTRTVTWPEAGKAVLELGSDDAVKVFLNGRQVFAKNATRPVTKGSDRVNLNMKAGENTLMIKLIQYAGNWGLAARLQPAGSTGTKAPQKKAESGVDLTKYPLSKPGWHLSSATDGDRVKVLLLTGQMNKHHRWEQTTPYMKKILESSGRFAVDVHSMPPRGSDLSDWDPRFEHYPVVLMNVDGEYWPEKTQDRFEKLVRSGKLGLVVVHSADNAWKDWGEWNEMIAVGGWGGRTVADGSWIRWRDGKMVVEQKDGPSGRHGPRHLFVIDHRTPDHPVTCGLPKSWIHHTDELYGCMRGPAKKVTVLGTAFDDPAKRGTGEHEPMLMAIRFGEGRIFHTTLGHDVEAMRCAGFQVTLQRGTEWAATDEVTLEIPDDFPTAEEPSLRSL